MTTSKSLTLLREFLAAHDLDLQHGVLILGGSSALMRLQRLRASVATADTFTSGHRRGMMWLKGLLGLEHVADINSEESGCFADLSPEDPAVPTLCLLYERLDETLARIDAVGDRDVAQDLDAAA
ncbi:hypothetical protein J7394_19835 [Ruegeria sp. R13_0]|uniref:hypothetical protein n=1 Tax=Ruegeria sp. R13_0 TaxID=2821099 RepID=UPI001ADBCAA1|nr:hypothetical protein [Ruegeria sp. R13_0]MBO9436475.1 hypothetical protein [Ruegeria sp. R13_0]